MKAVVDIGQCVREIEEILEKHNLSIFMMDEVLNSVRKDVYERTPVHPEKFD